MLFLLGLLVPVVGACIEPMVTCSEGVCTGEGHSLPKGIPSFDATGSEGFTGCWQKCFAHGAEVNGCQYSSSGVSRGIF